jgi:hypothetical protein
LHGDGGHGPVGRVAPAIKDGNTGGPITIKLVDAFGGRGGTGGRAIVDGRALDKGTSGPRIGVIDALGRSGGKGLKNGKEDSGSKEDGPGEFLPGIPRKEGIKVFRRLRHLHFRKSFLFQKNGPGSSEKVGSVSLDFTCC